MKTFSITLAIALLASLQMFAQVGDDFSDGDLAIDPSWQGTTQNFTVNTALQLQLNSTLAGSSWLSTGVSASAREDIMWEFWIKQSFAPSGANFGRVYLSSDHADLSAPLNGYYLQFGEAGSGDAIELFRQSGTTRQSVCRATSGAIAASFEIRVKILRSVQGAWQLFVDYTGGRDFVLEASGADATYLSAYYFGLACTYTISNAKGFYFDDISIETSIPPDRNPPQLLSLDVTSATALQLVFSEELETTAAHPSHYFVTPGGYGHPKTVELNLDGVTIVLAFADAFENGYQGTLMLNGLKDLAGNEMDFAEVDFQYFVPMPINFDDVIITEIYADPSPVVNLPDEEFVEVYNRSQNPVQLEGWLLSDGSSTGRFPAYVLMPGDYVVVCPSSAVAQYSAIGPALALSNFPTLNNGGDRLLLRDTGHKQIDSVHFTLEWYKDEDKASGGWALELIDPENLCGDGDNWRASEDARGGTPGERNSVYARKPDHMGPKLISVIAVAPRVLIVTFDEKIENAIPLAEQFAITPPVDVGSVGFTDASLRRLTLTLSDDVQSGKSYLLRVMGVYDCPGNRIQEAFSSAVFVLPQRAVAGDVIINEILFNPTPTGVDFVEIYNRSEKTIDLKGWSLRNGHSFAGKNTTALAVENLLIAPNEYMVYTEDVVMLKGEYVMGREESFLERNLPALNDDAGSVVLLDDNGICIDSMFYSSEMHSPFLKNDAGVSLERISAASIGAEIANWRSAASTAGFATPGYANSNLRADSPLTDDAVIIEPEIIQVSRGSDFAQIKYRFDNGGLIANVKIFDQEGRAIREIAGNQLLGVEGFFRWDADYDDGSTARRGYYFVWFEIFDDAGLVKTYKKRVVVY